MSEHERFDRIRRRTGFLLGPVVFLLVLAAPTGLAAEAHRLAAVFALVVVLWITESIPLPVTAVLGPALAVALGVAGPREAFGGFGHPILFLFLGSFLIAHAMMCHGLDRRIALYVLSRSWVGNRPARILLAFGAIAAVLSMWMSNTATTAMMLPIGAGVLRTLGGASGDAETGEGRSYATGLMLMIAYSCNVGGIATPVGTPPNLIAIGMIEEITGRRISFFEWMGFALPISIALFALLYLLMRRLFPARANALPGAIDLIRSRRAALGPWSRGEWVALAAFAVAVTLWTVPGAVSLAGIDSLREVLPEGPAAILAATILFVVPIDRTGKRALEWRQAVGIDWGTILLFGGGLSLGSLAFSTGLAAALGRGVSAGSGGMSIVVVALLALFLANVMTEFMSNTATANLLVPMFLALAATQVGGGPLLPAIAATLGCSLAFCLPVATPPNAIVYGSGRVPLPQMIRAGVLLDLACGLVAWAGLVFLLR